MDLCSDVILTRDIKEYGLRAGDVGTVVERHHVPDVAEEGYSVEFFDMTGNTVAVITVPSAHSAPSGPSSLKHYCLPGGASRLAALLLPQILPVFSVVAPCHPGAALRNPVLASAKTGH